VALTDEKLYRRLFPYLNREVDLRWVGEGAAPLAAVSAGGVWLVYSGEEADRAPNDRVARALAGTGYPIEDRWLPNARLRHFAGGPALAERPVGATVGESLTLRAAAFSERPAAGEPVLVALWWSAERPTAGDLKVFVHLAGADGRPVRQDDTAPVLGLAPVGTWTPGETVVDRHALAAAPPGRYRLLVGMYEAGSGARLHVARDGRAVGDAVELGEVEVVGR
jgi:hypothetical protein